VPQTDGQGVCSVCKAICDKQFHSLDDPNEGLCGVCRKSQREAMLRSAYTETGWRKNREGADRKAPRQKKDPVQVPQTDGQGVCSVCKAICDKQFHSLDDPNEGLCGACRKSQRETMLRSAYTETGWRLKRMRKQDKTTKGSATA
jgi:hypothetical protein